MTNKSLLAAFERELRSSDKNPWTIRLNLIVCRGFLRFIGTQDVGQLSAETVRAFFQGRKLNRASKRQYAVIVGRFLRFAAQRTPAPRARKLLPADKPQPTDTAALALHERWAADRQQQRHDDNEDLIARLAHKLIDHFLYFQGRLQGEPENLDDVCRFADECKLLIEANLPLFMRLSAQGKNVHSKIDERVQR